MTFDSPHLTDGQWQALSCWLLGRPLTDATPEARAAYMQILAWHHTDRNAITGSPGSLSAANRDALRHTFEGHALSAEEEAALEAFVTHRPLPSGSAAQNRASLALLRWQHEARRG